jgi:hypothetical protein
MNDSSKPESPAFGDALQEAKATYHTGEDQGWLDFRDQCRRQMERPLTMRLKFGFCRMHKPVLDDAPWRAFETMAEYRAWCADALPEYLGFKPARK